MKRSSLFKLALKRAKNNKKNIFFIILFTISSTLLLGVLNFRMNYAKMMDDSFNKDISFRTLIVDMNNDFYNGELFDQLYEKQMEETGEFLYDRIDSSIYNYERLKDIDYVVDGYYFKYHRVGVEARIDGVHNEASMGLLYGTIKNIPENVVGRKFKEGEKNVLICPINFKVIYGKTVNDLLDIDNPLGKKITISYDVAKWENHKRIVERQETKEYEIIGLYNSEDLMIDNFACYAPGEEIVEITDSKRLNYDEGNIAYVIHVDSRKNVDYVMKEIEKLGYKVNVQSYFDDEGVASINLIAISSFVLVLVVIIIISITYIRKKVINNTTEIGLLKAIGFNDRETKLYNIFEIISLILISFVISAVLINIIFGVLYNTLFVEIVSYGYELKLFIMSYILTLIITGIIPIGVDVWFVHRRCKKSIIQLLKGENV